MFKNEVIDRSMHCIMQNLKKIAQVCTYYLADLNIGHCVHEVKLGRLFMLTF